MDPIENAAHVSIGRACGFAGLGIFCVMVGLSYEPDLAARAGGMLFLIMVLILAFRAGTARTRPYKKTELWLIIDKEKRPPEGIAQQVVGEALREAYLSFAESTALIAFVLLIAALVLGFAGGADIGPPITAGAPDPSIDPRPTRLLLLGPGFNFLQTP